MSIKREGPSVINSSKLNVIYVKRLIKSDLILLAHSHRGRVLSRVVKVADNKDDNSEKGHRNDENAALGDYSHYKTNVRSLPNYGVVFNF